MRISQVYIIIANMWLVGSFLIDGVLASFMMMFLGCLWILGAFIGDKFEREIGRLERRAKHMMIMQGFDLVENLLKQMPKEKPKRKKR